MIAISVHEMVSVTTKFLPELLENFVDVVTSEVSVAQMNTLLVFELFAKFAGLKDEQEIFTIQFHSI